MCVSIHVHIYHLLFIQVIYSHYIGYEYDAELYEIASYFTIF